MFFHAFLENFIYKRINTKDNKNFQSSIMFLISSVTLFLIYLTFFGFKNEDFLFLKDYKFYILCFLEIGVFYLYRENYNQNKNNYTMVNMFVFSTIYLMPIMAYFYNQIFSFDSSLDIKYESFIEAFIFSFTLFILTSIYYISKIKNKEVKNLKLLILLLFVLLNTMYFAVKTVQTYNGFLIYSFIQIVITINFFILSQKGKNKEQKTITLKDIVFYFLWPIYFSLFFLAAALMSVEFVTISKRISQIISAMILDKKVIKKDFILIGFIFIITICFYFYKS
jgi:hypothetical protein